jgi:hypothetical protein
VVVVSINSTLEKKYIYIGEPARHQMISNTVKTELGRLYRRHRSINRYTFLLFYCMCYVSRSSASSHLPSEKKKIEGPWPAGLLLLFSLDCSTDSSTRQLTYIQNFYDMAAAAGRHVEKYIIYPPSIFFFFFYSSNLLFPFFF